MFYYIMAIKTTVSSERGMNLVVITRISPRKELGMESANLLWVENSVGEGENADYQHFLLFRKCFQKTPS